MEGGREEARRGEGKKGRKEGWGKGGREVGGWGKKGEDGGEGGRMGEGRKERTERKRKWRLYPFEGSQPSRSPPVGIFTGECGGSVANYSASVRIDPPPNHLAQGPQHHPNPIEARYSATKPPQQPYKKWNPAFARLAVAAIRTKTAVRFPETAFISI